MLDHYLKLILKAPVYEVATETNLEFAEALTKKFESLEEKVQLFLEV